MVNDYIQSLIQEFYGNLGKTISNHLKDLQESMVTTITEPLQHLLSTSLEPLREALENLRGMLDDYDNSNRNSRIAHTPAPVKDEHQIFNLGTDTECDNPNAPPKSDILKLLRIQTRLLWNSSTVRFIRKFTYDSATQIVSGVVSGILVYIVLKYLGMQ